MTAERVPGSAVLAGVPQGIFVGRSLLTGRAVCLMFLDRGRVSRAIPSGGLDDLDWTRHRIDHAGDCGTWELDGGVMTISWGDGGLHRGPLTVGQTGIEFYGKHYATPVTVELSALVGAWEAASGMAIVGGDGIDRLSSLSIAADGRYMWTEVVGGMVAGRATVSGGSASGTVRISGQTMTFHADDGTSRACTFLPVSGDPLEAFSLDAEMLTRTA